MKWIIAGIAALVIVVVASAVLLSRDSTGAGVSADIQGQGGEGEQLAADGAWLARSPSGLRVRVVVPTPSPGSYEYPTGDMVVAGAAPHPDVIPGGAGAPEVFTLWSFVFNRPDLCTDDTCDFDDLDTTAPAKGGVFQTDGRIADGDELDLVGSVRVGQTPSTGSSLENPIGAEIHVAIAPHGKALSGPDLYRQLNGALGNPSLWWAASFFP